MKFDLFSVKPDSVLTILSLSDVAVSSSLRYSIFLSFSICDSSYKSKSLILFANKFLSGSPLNSSSGVIFVVSIHFSIKVFIFSSNKLDEEIDDFFYQYKL